jgi:hypothetical protein
MQVLGHSEVLINESGDYDIMLVIIIIMTTIKLPIIIREGTC